ncbi:hypothetical protein LTR84_006319 [Exophiala bonariae]|uniref:Major facilitator superfamily (MFS) profile domain-containing protein n=1 Tax=Exophiala bonariae TaxID=1690606 RepID=A0AAV9N0V9_9EURO|nr:hypothetical protein LTR84_006319 [Exophiala bonariae]
MMKVESSQHAAEVEKVDEAASALETVDREPTYGAPRSRAARIILMTAVVGAYFAQVFHIVGTGFLTNTITGAIGGADLGTWLTSSLTIILTALGPCVCQGADLWGRKWLVVVLNCAGCVGTLVLSRSNTIGMAIGGQVISGFAHASQPVIHAVASEIIPRRHRPIAQAAINTAAGLGGVGGLLAAGALTSSDPFGFRIYFYIAAAIYGLATLAFALLYNPPKRDLQVDLTLRQKLDRLDFVGYVLLVVGSVLLCYGLTSSAGQSSWTSAEVLAPLLIGAFVLGLFGVYEWRFRKDGLVHHQLFSRGRNFAVAQLCIFTEGMVFFSSNSYYAAEVVLVYNKSSFRAGLYYSVAWFALIVAAWVAGTYCSWSRTVRLPTMVAFFSFCLFGGLMASLNPSKLNSMIGFAPFVGIGLGTALNALVVVAQLSIPPELISASTALMITTRSLGGTVGLSSYFAIFNGVLHKELAPQIIQAVAPLGFNLQYLGELIGASLSHSPQLLQQVPGLTPEIQSAASLAINQAFSFAFRYVWIAALVASVCGLTASYFLIDPKSEFSATIDAPMDKAPREVKVNV